jgi:hypothetical protein
VSGAEPVLIAVGPLPGDAPAAAAEFHARVQPLVLAAIDGGAALVTLAFAPADHAHQAWRLAAVQTLAAARTPARINAVAGDDAAAIAAAQTFIAGAPGLTGQYLVLDGAGAGAVVG